MSRSITSTIGSSVGRWSCTRNIPSTATAFLQGQLGQRGRGSGGAQPAPFAQSAAHRLNREQHDLVGKIVEGLHDVLGSGNGVSPSNCP